MVRAEWESSDWNDKTSSSSSRSFKNLRKRQCGPQDLPHVQNTRSFRHFRRAAWHYGKSTSHLGSQSVPEARVGPEKKAFIEQFNLGQGCSHWWTHTAHAKGGTLQASRGKCNFISIWNCGLLTKHEKWGLLRMKMAKSARIFCDEIQRMDRTGFILWFYFVDLSEGIFDCPV